MTEKMYLSFPRVTYGLRTEILDGPQFSPIFEGTKHFAKVVEVVMCIGADIIKCSKGFPLDDSDSRMFPQYIFLPSIWTLNIFSKIFTGSKQNWIKSNIYIREIHFGYGFRA